MQYLDLSKYYQLGKFDFIVERLTLEEFQTKFPGIEHIQIGHINKIGKKLTDIREIYVNSYSGIYQLSEYKNDDTDDILSVHISFDMIASFKSPPTLTDEFEKTKERLRVAELLAQSVLTGSNPVINPDTFEPFDKNSPEWFTYCSTVTANLEGLRVQTEELRKLVEISN